MTINRSMRILFGISSTPEPVMVRAARCFTFALSYELLTTITEQYISQCIQKAMEIFGREADIEMDWAGASEKLFIDFCCPTIPVINTDTGEIRRVAIFVAMMEASNYT